MKKKGNRDVLYRLSEDGFGISP